MLCSARGLDLQDAALEVLVEVVARILPEAVHAVVTITAGVIVDLVHL